METANLGHLISAAVAAKLTPEYIETEVGKRLDKLLTDSIDSALRTYSTTGKEIERAVQDALRVDRLDLPNYGSIVCTMVKAQIESRVADVVAGRLAQDVEDLLNLAPKTIKLSQIAETMLEQHDDGYGPVITVEVEHTQYDSAWVYLDEDNHYETRANFEADHQLLIRKDGTISSYRYRGKDVRQSKEIGSAYGLDQRLRAYVACGTVIELDEDNVCTIKGDY